MIVVPDVKPSLRCLVGRPNETGKVIWSQVVTLDEAEERMRDGWAVIGPDPHDEIELAAWYARQNDGA